MEQIFIQKIFALTEQILRGEYTFDPMLKELQNHLARAEKLKMVQYQAEVLNTFGIMYLSVDDAAQSRGYFSRGLERAELTDNIDLKMKLLSNLAEACINLWDIDSADRYADRAFSLNKANNLNDLATLYIYGNKINCQVLQGNFDQAAVLLAEVWRHADSTDLLKVF